MASGKICSICHLECSGGDIWRGTTSNRYLIVDYVDDGGEDHATEERGKH